MQRQLKEREGEASGETEVGDRAQRWKAWWTRPPALGQRPSSRMQPSTPSNYRERDGERERRQTGTEFINTLKAKLHPSERLNVLHKDVKNV